MVFWLVCLVLNTTFIVVNHGINYSAISGALIALWMLSLNDIVIDKISKQYKKHIQQILRILLILVIGLNILDFMALI